MKYDIICVFGRGIEKVNGVWKPTQHIERLSEKNGHAGARADGIHMNDDDPRVVIAGAESNVTAASLLYNRQAATEGPPQIVVFAAGRPAYLADDPDLNLTEGSVLKEEFLKYARVDLPWLPLAEVIIQGLNRNTRDDLLQTLRLARERGLRNIAVISVLVHLARCREFLKKAVETEPEFGGYTVHFLASEMILMQEMPWLASSSLLELLVSAAYCRTAERERKGIEDLRASSYDFGSQGYAFAPTKS